MRRATNENTTTDRRRMERKISRRDVRKIPVYFGRPRDADRKNRAPGAAARGTHPHTVAGRASRRLRAESLRASRRRPMKALTIKAPWAQAIVYGTKRIENRTWKPHADVIGKRIAIHCGRSRALTENYSGLAARNQLLMAWNGPIVPRRGTITTDLGHIIGTARVVGWVDGRVGQGLDRKSVV